MKFNKILIGVIFTLTTSLYAGKAPTTLETIQSMKIFSNPGVKLLGYTEHQSTYHVRGIIQNQSNSSPFEAFITKDLKEVVFGKGFEADTQKPLTISIDTKKYLKDETLTYGDGKDEYLLFTDPECPYCQKLEKILPLMKKYVKIHIFLYPLSFHKNSKPMSYYIMSQKTDKSKHDAINKIAHGATDYKDAKFSLSELENYKQLLAKQSVIASELGVSGTPALYDMNGNKIEWMNLLGKYSIKEPIDMQGIKFLSKNNLNIRYGNHDTKHKENIYIFSSIGTDKELTTLKKAITQYEKKYFVNVYLKLTNNPNSLLQLKAVYSQNSNKERVIMLNKLMRTKKLDAQAIKEAQKMTKDEETKYLPVAYVMKNMHIEPQKNFIILDKDGKIIE